MPRSGLLLLLAVLTLACSSPEDPAHSEEIMEGCGYIASARLTEEKPEAVIVAVTTSTPTFGSCRIRHPVRLKDPIGDRPIIHETTGETVAETGG